MAKYDEIKKTLRNLSETRQLVTLAELHVLLMRNKIVYEHVRKDWVKTLLATNLITRDEKNDQIFHINKAELLI